MFDSFATWTKCENKMLWHEKKVIKFICFAMGELSQK